MTAARGNLLRWEPELITISEAHRRSFWGSVVKGRGYNTNTRVQGTETRGLCPMFGRLSHFLFRGDSG